MKEHQNTSQELMNLWESAIFGAELGGSAPSVDLHGMDVIDASRSVEQFIDNSFMAGDQVVEIIHGKGTGILRTTVQEILKKHPLIEYFRDAQSSGKMTGVTYAVIAKRT